MLAIIDKMGFDQEWIRLDQMVHFYNEVLCRCKWYPIWFLPKLYKIKTKISSFSPFVCEVMKATNCLLERAEGRGGGWGVGFVGCRVKEEGVEVSHLLFIDNTLVFCKASHSHMVYLSWLFIWFEAILGLKINLQKSEVIFIGKVANVEDLATKLGC